MNRSKPRRRAGVVSLLVGLVSAGCAAAPVAPSGSWQVCASPTQASLRGIAAVDPDTAWVTGSGGTVLRTRDGGGSWHAVAPPGCEACDFRDVVAFDADTALVMVAGAPAQIWRTDDGGGSWRVVFADARPAAFFDALAACGDYVVLFGDPVQERFYVVESFDAGRSFSPLAPDAMVPTIAGEAGFAASGSCVCAFDVGRFGLVTGGGAVRFVRRDARGSFAARLPLSSGAASRGAFSVAFEASGTNGVAVGGDYAAPEHAAGTAAITRDGGVTWRAAAVGPDGYRSAVLWCDDGSALAAGPQGCSWSGDGGDTWSPFGELGFHCMARAGGAVWAAGAGGRIARLLLDGSR